MPIDHQNPMCWWCKHFIIRPARFGYHFSCAAFPQEIPEQILESSFDHREPYPGDQGIHFDLAAFEEAKDRLIFKISSRPELVFERIYEMLQEFDTYRTNGWMEPPLRREQTTGEDQA